MKEEDGRVEADESLAVIPSLESNNPAVGKSSLPPPRLPEHIRIPSAISVDKAGTATFSSYLQNLSLNPASSQSPPRSKTYGAPRVFDLFTLLAITLAFAVLFALLGLLAPALDMSAMALTVGMGLFVAMVGLSQMWLFGSNNPRVASLISGPFAFAIILLFPISRATNSLMEGALASLCVGLFFGPVAGYLAGAVVAGVFLLADQFRNSFNSAKKPSKDLSFDEVD